MGDDGGTEYVTQQTNQNPWEPQQAYLKKGFEQAQAAVLDKPQEYYPGSTTVPFSPQTEQALGLAEQRALTGSPLIDGAQGNINKTLSGAYLNGGNPAYGNMVERSIAPMRREYQETVMPGINAAFSAGGRYGSNSQANAMDHASDTYLRNVGNTTAGLAYQNYGDERSNQMQAAGMAPELAQQDYYDIAQLGQVGTTREGMAQNVLNEDINRYNFTQEEPADRLGKYMSLISGGYGGSGNSTQAQTTPGFNPVLGTLGAASTAAGLANSMYGGSNPLFQKWW